MSTEPRIIDRRFLDALTAAAQAHPRRRQNFNLHADYAEPYQRLLNAVEPDSYIRPHRHLTPPKPETFLSLRGRFAVGLFRPDGGIDHAILLDPAAGVQGVDIPAGAWHTIIALDSGAVFFEGKPGPYEAMSDKDWAPWAPVEGSPGADEYLTRLKTILLANR